MLGAYGAILLILAGCWLTGQAAHRAAAAASPLAPATGLAVLICLSAAAIRLPGHGVTAGVVLVAVMAACVAVLRRRLTPPTPAELVVAALVLAAVSIPFAVNGRFGIIGMSFLDDMALHLALADGLRLDVPVPLGPESRGYPVGPQALAGALAGLLGTGTPATLAAVLMAVPVLTALAALQAFEGLDVVRRVAGAVTVGLAYLAIAFFAEGSPKETVMALLVLAFTLGLRKLVREPGGARRALPLGVLTAGAMLTYGAAGAVWPVAIAGAWLALSLLLARGRPARSGLAAASRAVAVVSVACLVGVLGQIDRVITFSATETVASAGGDPRWFPGHLRGYLPFVEALGLWPSPNYRAILPELALTLGICAGIAVAVAGYGAVWWLRRGDYVVPLSAVVSAGIWFATRFLQGPYVNSKVLAITAPLLLTAMVRPLMAEPRPGRRRSLDDLALTAAAATVVALAVGSASLPLRFASVGPLDHAREISSLRGALGDRPVLFAAKDNFVVWELLGANLSMTDPYGQAFDSRVRVDFRGGKPRGVGTITDFDTVPPSSLDRFDHVITSRSKFASAPSSNWRATRHTRFHTLWSRVAATPPRSVLPAERAGPGAVLDCGTPLGRRLRASGGVAGVRVRPVVGRPGDWTREGGGKVTEDPAHYVGLEPGDTLRQSIDLPPGRWEVSLQYLSARDLRLTAPGFGADLPANLTAQGNYWRAGTLESPGGPVTFTVETGPPPLVGPRPAVVVGAFAAVRADDRVRVVPLASACGEYVDWYRSST